MKEKLEPLLDASKWTKENRDSMLNQIDALLSKFAVETDSFVRAILEKEDLLKTIVYKALLTQQVQFLQEVRGEVDVLGEEDLAVDYAWINGNIREIVGRINLVEEAVTKALEEINTIEDL